jgi:hypothetical protein
MRYRNANASGDGICCYSRTISYTESLIPCQSLFHACKPASPASLQPATRCALCTRNLLQTSLAYLSLILISCPGSPTASACAHLLPVDFPPVSEFHLQIHIHQEPTVYISLGLFGTTIPQPDSALSYIATIHHWQQHHEIQSPCSANTPLAPFWA